MLEHPIDGLVFASKAEQLLVVRTHGNGAVAGALLGSVSQGVLHHANSSIAVVPSVTDG